MVVGGRAWRPSNGFKEFFSVDDISQADCVLPNTCTYQITILGQLVLPADLESDNIYCAAIAGLREWNENVLEIKRTAD